jgi:hypothetical protein
LPEIVRQFKTFSARRINQHRGMPGIPLWQRNYYEHIIRDEESLNRIREYIVHNPLQWALDRENPGRVPWGHGMPCSYQGMNHGASDRKPPSNLPLSPGWNRWAGW